MAISPARCRIPTRTHALEREHSCTERAISRNRFQSALGTVFLAANQRMDGNQPWGDPMFHHALSLTLSTVFELAFAILPAAPLLAIKRLSPSPVDHPAKSALTENSAPPIAEKA